MTTVMYTPFAKCVQVHSLELCLSISFVKKDFAITLSDVGFCHDCQTHPTALDNHLVLYVDLFITTFEHIQTLREKLVKN